MELGVSILQLEWGKEEGSETGEKSGCSVDDGSLKHAGVGHRRPFHPLLRNRWQLILPVVAAREGLSHLALVRETGAAVAYSPVVLNFPNAATL